jgi:hypothetical protein
MAKQQGKAFLAVVPSIYEVLAFLAFEAFRIRFGCIMHAMLDLGYSTKMNFFFHSSGSFRVGGGGRRAFDSLAEFDLVLKKRLCECL